MSKFKLDPDKSNVFQLGPREIKAIHERRPKPSHSVWFWVGMALMGAAVGGIIGIFLAELAR